MLESGDYFISAIGLQLHSVNSFIFKINIAGLTRVTILSAF